MSSAVPITLELTFLAMLMALAAGIPLGALAASKAGTLLDSVIGTATFALLAVPVFVMGLMMVQAFVFQTDFAQIDPPRLWPGDQLPPSLVPGCAVANFARSGPGWALSSPVFSASSSGRPCLNSPDRAGCRYRRDWDRT